MQFVFSLLIINNSSNFLKLSFWGFFLLEIVNLITLAVHVLIFLDCSWYDLFKK